MSQVKAILFDFGGTLRRTVERSQDERIEYLKKIMHHLDWKKDPEDFFSLLKKRANDYEEWALENEIELTEPELWTRWMLPDYPKELIRDLAVEFNQIWRDSAGERQLLPNAKETIQTLFRRDYRLGLISNTTSSLEAYQVFKEHGLTGFFETVVLSTKVGTRKPSSRIMLEAADRLNVSPAACAYVGNKPERDVLAARRAGFNQTVIIRNPKRPLVTPLADEMNPDHFIDDLIELLTIFPPVRMGRSKLKSIPRYDIALSTMWGIKNYSNLEDFNTFSTRMGFSSVELNHQISPEMLTGIHFNPLKVRSIHEPCPALVPAAVLKKEDILISSPDEARRKEGIDSIKRSIDLAVELGSQVVVVHCGQIQADWSEEKELFSLLVEDKMGSTRYQEIKEKFIEQRKRLIEPFFSAVKKSIKELLEYAGKRSITLGIENRYHFGDIPLIDELGEILALAELDRIGFIYDVGHAHSLDRLGFASHDAWLEKYSSSIIGAHIHDAIGVHDHRAPGMGEVDFKKVAKALPKEAFRTLEIQSFVTPDEIRQGLHVLVDCGCIKLLN